MTSTFTVASLVSMPVEGMWWLVAVVRAWSKYLTVIRSTSRWHRSRGFRRGVIQLTLIGQARLHLEQLVGSYLYCNTNTEIIDYLYY